jgi:hypothetical protein
VPAERFQPDQGVAVLVQQADQGAGAGRQQARAAAAG